MATPMYSEDSPGQQGNLSGSITWNSFYGSYSVTYTSVNGGQGTINQVTKLCTAGVLWVN